MFDVPCKTFDLATAVAVAYLLIVDPPSSFAADGFLSMSPNPVLLDYR